ncbi:glycosyltransferase family protein [Oceanimonas smirnovii]|uniref:Glycosyltransferase family 1 protein n=1 Tax=Oceanimonas smirnovii TaxID=264574 RepID=A0ABW7P3W9_9GAMM
MSWLIVEQGANPSSDFFVKPALSKEAFTVCNLSAQPHIKSDSNKINIAFVRYLTPQWMRWVEQHSHVIGRLAFFMDDDLFDLTAHTGLPLRYRWKLYRLAFRHQKWLRLMNAELWVSNNSLASKYQQWNPRVLSPHTPYADNSQQKTLFYHGSASHMQEVTWLLPVVEEVLQQDTTFSFEIIGNSKVRTLFSHLPRVHVLQPMSWPAYKALVSRPGRTIGLAPLLPSEFNTARSATKFFDITQAGAVGIYAKHPVYSTMVQDQHNGLLLDMVQAEWANAILQLGNDEAARSYMLNNAQQKMKQG